MSDIPNRAELERQLTRLMARLLSAYGGRLLEVLGDPPNLSNIPPGFWDDESTIMLEALRPFGERVYLQAAKQLMAATPGGLDWTLINQRAVDWAGRYMFDLIKGLNNTTREALQRVLASYFQSPMPRSQLEARILELVGSPIRAEMIAVTEVTRAASEGEQEVARELAEQGINLKPVWNTNNDEIVCPVCEPRNSQEITDNFYPPAHPRCRCWVSHEIRRA